jgi:LuxR family maltose regulon positive regulatory protein
VTRPLAEAVRMARRSGNVLAETYGLGYLALAAAESGDLVDAARLVPLALELCADPGVAEHFVAALPHLARATLLAASGRADGASDAAARALTLARRGACLLELALALAVRARTVALQTLHDFSPQSRVAVRTRQVPAALRRAVQDCQRVPRSGSTSDTASAGPPPTSEGSTRTAVRCGFARPTRTSR